ncbi:MAG: hypothetical protein GY856_17125, partial [bacterium]|nr:hypothetical protein [bacterium]
MTTEKASWPRRRAANWIPVLVWGLVLVPLILHLALVPSYGRLQGNDYYGVLQRLSDGRQLETDLSTWLGIRIAYHRVTVPALIWALNIALFHGSNIPTAVLALLFLLGLFLILEHHLPASVRDRSPERWLVAAILSVLVFPQVLCVNLALSFAGIHYYLSDLLAILAFGLLVRGVGSRFGPWPLVILGLVGTFTFSSHLVVWPALMAGAFLLRRRRRDFAVLAVGAGIAVSAYLWDIQRPPSSWPEADAILRYVGIFLGAPFTRDPELALALGGIALGLSVLLHLLIRFRRPGARPTAAFWLMVQLYALGNGLLAALGRSVRWGESQALTRRYCLFPALFWAGLVVAATLLLRDTSGRRRLAVVLTMVLTLAAVVVAEFPQGLPMMAYYARRGGRQEVAELALLWSSWDKDLILSTVSLKLPGVIGNIELMKRLGHVPFDRAVPAMPNQRVPRGLLSPRPHPEVEGALLEVRSTENPGLLRVRGWAYHPTRRVEEVVFVDRRRRRRSRILCGHDRHTMRELLGRRAASKAGWEGFVEWRRYPEIWTAYVRLASDPTFYPLP